MNIVETLTKHIPPEGKEYAHMYITTPTGWDDMIYELHRKLFLLDPYYTLHQCKEKFGGLRFYATPTDESLRDEFWAIIGEFEQLSWKVCQDCGSMMGQLRTGGWYLTLCDECNIVRESNEY